MHWLGVVLLICVCQPSLGANILGFFYVPSHSHQIVYNRLMRELSEQGHSLTIITPLPQNDPTLHNYTEIDTSYSFDYLRKKFDYASDDNTLIRWFPEIFLAVMIEVTQDLCEMYLSDPRVKEIMDNDVEYDLLFVEWGMGPCIYAFADKVKDRKMIGMTSFILGSVGQIKMGSTSNPAYVPEIGFPYTDHMSFTQRLRNTIFYGVAYAVCQLMVHQQNAIVKKHFGPNVTDLFQAERDVSLILSNSHFTTVFPRPHSANIIPIGGPVFHLLGRPQQPLPKDIQEFLDSAKDGVIYFSLGSNVKSSAMPDARRAVFLNAFRQIKQKVLWKWETEDLPDKPDNVKIGKWLPQTDILAHPNVKAFITQGGLQSMGESTHFTKPMIVIPFFADQELNAKKLVSVGVAIKLDFETVTTEELLDALNQIVNNPQYKENVIKYSDLTKDQPESPMERAVWWTEYVIRHKGARHLRSAAVDMPWYQYFLIDVIAFLLLLASAASYVSYVIIRSVFRRVFKTNKVKKE